MARKPAPKNEKSTAAQTSLLPAEARVIRPVPLAEIQPDPRQPRTDNEKKTANVANICETLKVDEGGVARPQHPIQIRKTPPWAEDQKRAWMIFDGECRYLASTIKGAVAIDADTIEIPEAEVHERQVLTAMAREGLGPTALLEALRRFDQDHPDINAQNAGARLGMKTDVVRSLRKVNVLPAEVRLRFMGGEHTLEVCDSLARIDGITQEERAERQCFASKAVAGMTPKKAREYIASQFLLRLATAPFDREDPTLNLDAGVCSACPHRTGAQTALFGETDSAEDCCTRPACWAIKVAVTEAKATSAEQKEERKPAKASGIAKPTKDDVLVAALLAAGHGAEDLDAKLEGKTREEIDASLERLAAHGNPKAKPALLDRRAKGKDLGGYSGGYAHAVASSALDAARDAFGLLGPADKRLLARSLIVHVIPGDVVSELAVREFVANEIACEPGGEPPPPPPVAESSSEFYVHDEEAIEPPAPIDEPPPPWDDDIDGDALLEEAP